MLPANLINLIDKASTVANIMTKIQTVPDNAKALPLLHKIESDSIALAADLAEAAKLIQEDAAVLGIKL